MDLYTPGKANPDWGLPMVCISNVEPSSLVQLTDCFRVVIILKGSGIATVGSQRMVFIAPAIFCINETECFSVYENRDVTLKTICFHPNVINSVFDYQNIRQTEADLTMSASQDRFWLKAFLERKPNYSGLLILSPGTIQKTVKLFQAIEQQLEEQPDNWPCRGRSFLIELLFLLQQIYSTNEREQPFCSLFQDESEMDQVILYLYTNFQRKITIHELAKVFNINRTTLMNRFVDVTGTTIHNYLINIRIHFACFLIRDTLLSLSDIMVRVGFSDLTNFGRTFKQITTYTPSDYRQKFCWMLQFYPDYHD
jgi:AraC family L-rhamnose operon regulatory protein RhaS